MNRNATFISGPGAVSDSVPPWLWPGRLEKAVAEEMDFRHDRITHSLAGHDRAFEVPSLRNVANVDRSLYVINLPRPPAPPVERPTIVIQQQWEGYVTEVREDDIAVRLLDMTKGSQYYRREAFIPLRVIPLKERPLVCEGNVFWWDVGYEWTPEGSQRSVSSIRFRNAPAVTAADIERARPWARKVAALFK